MLSRPALGVIGGSGIYAMPGLMHVQEHDLDTPFGKPSAPVILGNLEGNPTAFLARHGLGHHISPTEVNYRANIYALKSLGVERIVSISACGSLRQDYAPGSIVVPDQLIDFTRDRKRSFFGEGLVAHIGVAEPFCPDLSEQLYQAIVKTGATAHRGGTFVTVEGPRFSTRAESQVFQSWGGSLIGMTTSPEAFLAREAEICYAVMAHVTDYDVWHSTEAPVSVEAVIAVLNRNTQLAQQAVKYLRNELKSKRSCACADALSTALITHPNAIPESARKRLALLVAKYVNSHSDE
jgi:5'-methylthioadenosine phosphorylase